LDKILDDIISDINEGSIVALMSLDISAAFDAVNRENVAQRLEDEFAITMQSVSPVDHLLLDRPNVESPHRILCILVATCRQSSLRDLLAVLHWLPVCQRIDFLLANLCFKVHKLHQPSYLSAAELVYLPQRTLHSTIKELLIILYITVLDSRRFSVAAPTIWDKIHKTL